MHEKNVVIANYIFYIVELLSCIGFVLRREYSYLFNPVSMSLLYTVFLLPEKYTKFTFKFYLRVLLIITLSSHTILGEYFKLYEKSKYFDKVLHFIGAIAFSLVIYSILTTLIKVRSSHPRLTTFILITLLGISLGTLFEIVEFSMDVVLGEYNQRGLKDTDLDQIFNLIGAIFAGIYAAKHNPIQSLCKTKS